MATLDRFYYSALVRFIEGREADGGRGSQHLAPLVDWIEGQILLRGIPRKSVSRKHVGGGAYRRPIDLTVTADGEPPAYLLIVTQTGSVRKNLNNRRRDIFADGINLQIGSPGARVAVFYILQADDEARRAVGGRRSAIDDLGDYLISLQQSQPLISVPVFHAAALVAPMLTADGNISTVSVPDSVKLTSGFFDRWIPR